jgi:hypothetical protein
MRRERHLSLVVTVFSVILFPVLLGRRGLGRRDLGRKTAKVILPRFAVSLPPESPLLESLHLRTHKCLLQRCKTKKIQQTTNK